MKDFFANFQPFLPLFYTFILPSLLSENIDICLAGNLTLFEMRLSLQYVKMANDYTSPAHLMSTIPLERHRPFQAQFNQSGHWHLAQSPLDGLVLDSPSRECSTECLIRLNVMAKWRGIENAEFRIIPSAEIGICPEFVPLEGIPSIYCAKKFGYCGGATLPLYSFYSQQTKDQILRTKSKLYDGLDYSPEFDGKPICYIWPFPTVQIILPNETKNWTFQQQQNASELIKIAEKFAQSYDGNCCEGQITTTTAAMEEKGEDGSSSSKTPIAEEYEAEETSSSSSESSWPSNSSETDESSTTTTEAEEETTTEITTTEVTTTTESETAETTEDEEAEDESSTTYYADYEESTMPTITRKASTMRTTTIASIQHTKLTINTKINDNFGADLVQIAGQVELKFFGPTLVTSTVRNVENRKTTMRETMNRGDEADMGINDDDECFGFVPKAWLNDWRWWVVFGAVSALIFCCFIISFFHCCILCLQNAFEVVQMRANHHCPAHQITTRRPITGETYYK